MRLPQSIHEALERSKPSGVSLNQEIVDRLAASLGAGFVRQNDNGRLSFVGAAKSASRSTEPDEELSERVARLEEAINSLEPLELLDDQTGRRMLVLGKPLNGN